MHLGAWGYSFGLEYLLVKSKLRRSKEGASTCLFVSARLINTAAKRRDVAKHLLGQLRRIVENNSADFIAGAFNSAAYRERQAGVSSCQLCTLTRGISNEVRSLCSRAVTFCSVEAPQSSGSSSSWWEGWSGTYHGWSASTEPVPEPALDERVTNAVHRVQDLLQQTTVLSQRRSTKTHTERAVTISRGSAAYAAMEAATRARERQEEAKRLDAEAAYNEAIQCTLEKTEALEKLVKTVTMRAHSLAITEADFLQTLFERQEDTLRNAHRGTMSHAAFVSSFLEQRRASSTRRHRRSLMIRSLIETFGVCSCSSSLATR